MKQVKLVDSKNLDFNVRGDTPGMAYVARALSPEISPNIGVGFAKWEGANPSGSIKDRMARFIINNAERNELIKWQKNPKKYWKSI